MKDWPGYCTSCGKVTVTTAAGTCMKCGARKEPKR